MKLTSTIPEFRYEESRRTITKSKTINSDQSVVYTYLFDVHNFPMLQIRMYIVQWCTCTWEHRMRYGYMVYINIMMNFFDLRCEGNILFYLRHTQLHNYSYVYAYSQLFIRLVVLYHHVLEVLDSLFVLQDQSFKVKLDNTSSQQLHVYTYIQLNTHIQYMVHCYVPAKSYLIVLLLQTQVLLYMYIC